MILAQRVRAAGNKRTPQLFMKPGDVCEIEVDAVGVLRNGIRDE